MAGERRRADAVSDDATFRTSAFVM